MEHIKLPERRGELKALLHLAESLRRVETDPLRQAYWFGYLRGIRRAIAGEEYGTTEGHKRLHDIPEDEADRERREIGRGYRDGCKGERPEELF